MIGGTQDVSVIDELGICVRYTSHDVQERLLNLIICHDSSGIGLFNLLKKELTELKLFISDTVACSFDGAANV